MEEYSYITTHSLGHTGPVTGSLYLCMAVKTLHWGEYLRQKFPILLAILHLHIYSSHITCLNTLIPFYHGAINARLLETHGSNIQLKKTLKQTKMTFSWKRSSNKQRWHSVEKDPQTNKDDIQLKRILKQTKMAFSSKRSSNKQTNKHDTELKRPSNKQRWHSVEKDPQTNKDGI